ncbi:MAG: methyltransferase domain-containing protein [Candidatus Promineifilaceae bacterium]
MIDHERRFNPQKGEKLLSDERKARWKPPQFLERLDLQAGQVALDLGCGPGFWTLPLTEIVGPSGKVWALDVSQELLDALAQRNPPRQVHLIRNELPTIDLPDCSVDLTWAAFVYHEMESDGLAAELRRVVRPNGRVAILDWHPDGETDSEPPTEHRVWPKEVK